jgi:hypothetical protein
MHLENFTDIENVTGKYHQYKPDDLRFGAKW